MQSPGVRALLIGAWLALLAVGGWYALTQVKVANDLGQFLPEPGSAAERLIVSDLREGPASRLVIIGLAGDEPKHLAELSGAMLRQLRQQRLFLRVANGERQSAEALQQLIFEYRYLLSPRVDARRFSTEALREALQARLRELASPAEAFTQDLLARDPTGESLAILDAWSGGQEPARRYGVWFSPDGDRALILAQTRAAGFDLDAQQQVVAAIESAFAQARSNPAVGLELVGPGPFGVAIRERTRGEAQWFSALAVAALLLFLFWVYRSFYTLLLGALPLASGALAGTLAVAAFFGGIHGITLAFGVTLFGVAIDYPLHFFSHRMPGREPDADMRRIWPTLRLGVLSTCIAYLTMVFTDIGGLAQLGVFTVAGLAVAAACTRWLLPVLMSAGQGKDVAEGKVRGMQRRLAQAPVLPWLAPILIVVSLLTLWLTPTPLWQDDLNALTPVPQRLQALDKQLRSDLGAPDLRYLAVIQAPDRQAALRQSEGLSTKLEALVRSGAIQAYDLAARYLPSEALQRQRRAVLPAPQVLQGRLQAAGEGLPFKPGLFAPFLEDISAARQQPPLTAEALADTPLQARIDPLLYQRSGGEDWLALVTLSGVEDAAGLSAWFQANTDESVNFVDLKSSSEGMVAGFRDATLLRVAIALGAILLIMLGGLRPPRRAVIVLLPVAAAVLAEVALLNLLGLQLNLFHLISLMLVAGIALDYALFFNRDDPEAAERSRTLHALSVCCISTITVFGILSLSQIPVLHAIGITVATGVAGGFVLAALGARSDNRESGNQFS